MMKEKRWFLAAVLVLTLASASGASAQDQVAEQGVFDRLVAAVHNIDAEISALEGLADLQVTKVQVVNAQGVARGREESIEVLNGALSTRNAEILTLQKVLDDHEIIKDALKGHNIQVEDVVAVHVLKGGHVIIFYE